MGVQFTLVDNTAQAQPHGRLGNLEALVVEVLSLLLALDPRVHSLERRVELERLGRATMVAPKALNITLGTTLQVVAVVEPVALVGLADRMVHLQRTRAAAEATVLLHLLPGHP